MILTISIILNVVLLINHWVNKDKIKELDTINQKWYVEYHIARLEYQGIKDQFYKERGEL